MTAINRILSMQVHVAATNRILISTSASTCAGSALPHCAHAEPAISLTHQPVHQPVQQMSVCLSLCLSAHLSVCFHLHAMHFTICHGQNAAQQVLSWTDRCGAIVMDDFAPAFQHATAWQEACQDRKRQIPPRRTPTRAPASSSRLQKPPSGQCDSKSACRTFSMIGGMSTRK
jgi:hypothetical protein